MLKKSNYKYILLLFPPIIFLWVYFYLNFDGLYGQDAFEYLRYSKALQNFIITGNNPGTYFWPLFYPLLGSLFGFFTHNIALALLLISVFSLSVSAFYLNTIIDLLFPNSKLSILHIFVFFILSPFILKSGLLIMSDMLALCLIVLTLYHYLKFNQNYSIKYFYYITIFSVSAMMTRYVSFVIVIPFIIHASYLFLTQKKNLKHIPFLMLIVFIIGLPHFLINATNSLKFLSNNWLKTWSVLNFFKSQFSTVDGFNHYLFPNIIYVFSNFFHPRFLFIGIFLIPLLFIKNSNFKHRTIILISVILYALFLAGIPYQNNRFLVLSFPLILLLFYPIFIYLTELKLIKKIFYVGIICTIIIQSFLISKAFKSTLERNKLERKMVELLRPYQHKKLYSFDIDIALQGRGLKFDYKNLWIKRYKNLQKGDLILFNPTKFQKQWQGKNPILNFNYFNEKYDLKIIQDCQGGWKLYQVETKF